MISKVTEQLSLLGNSRLSRKNFEGSYAGKKLATKIFMQVFLAFLDFGKTDARQTIYFFRAVLFKLRTVNCLLDERSQSKVREKNFGQSAFEKCPYISKIVASWHFGTSTLRWKKLGQHFDSILFPS